MHPPRRRAVTAPWTAAPTPRDESERLRRLDRLGVRPGQRHEVLDQITALAASLLDAPIALVSLVSEDQQFCLSRHGLDATCTGRDESFCGHAIGRPIPFAVPDSGADPRFASNPLVRGAPHVQAYLGAPLFVAPGQSGIGTLCVIDHRPREFTPQHQRDLVRLSTLVESYLEDLGLRRAWEDSPLSMVTLDADGRCVRTNPAFARMLGRESSSLLDRPLTSFLLPSDRAVLIAMHSHAVVHAESPTRRELRFVRLNGEVVLGGTSLSPLSEPRDQVVCVIRDISLERRAAARTGVVADVRRELAEPLDRARSNALTLGIRDPSVPVAPILRELDEVEGLLDARIGDIAARVRAEAELVVSEQRLRAVMEHAIGMLVVIDDRGRIVDANAVALSTLGWRFEELVGSSMRHVEPSFTGAECDRWFASTRTRAAGEGELEAEPTVFVCRDGRELHVERSMMEMDWNGPGRLVLLVRDVSEAHAREARLVTERERLEVRVRSDGEALDALQQMERALKASLEEKETLLKEIHHRVKNNLQMVSSLLTLQMDQMPDERARALVSEGVQRVRSMALIHQHLYGTASLERVDLKSYSQSLTEYLRHTLAPTARLRVEAEQVEVDVQRAAPVGLVLNELLTNAFKYGLRPPGAIPIGGDGVDPQVADVEVSISERDQRARIVVRDRGRGLPADFDLARSPSLGLQLVRTLTRQLRGRVTARTEGGAVFELEFPL